MSRYAVAENMQIALCLNPSIFAYVRRCLQRKDNQRISELLNLVGLTDFSQQLVGWLSHGQTQWLEIGMVLAQNPELVLLDEPTAGMTLRSLLKDRLLNSAKILSTSIRLFRSRRSASRQSGSIIII